MNFKVMLVGGIRSILRKQFLVTALLVLGATLSAQAQVLWYNGDYDMQGGLIGTENSATGNDSGFVYDDFNVTTPMGWDVKLLFGNFLYSTPATPAFPVDAVTTSAYWEIRSGVSDGNGGTVVFSGLSPITVNQIGTDRGYAIEQVSIDGLDLSLDAGTYWLGIQPVASDGFGYLGTANGTNAVGTPAGDDSNAFYSDSSGTYYFTSATVADADNGSDFSLGIKGIAVVPEPSTWALLFAGMALFGIVRLGKQPLKVVASIPKTDDARPRRSI